MKFSTIATFIVIGLILGVPAIGTSELPIRILDWTDLKNAPDDLPYSDKEEVTLVLADQLDFGNGTWNFTRSATVDGKIKHWFTRHLAIVCDVAIVSGTRSVYLSAMGPATRCLFGNGNAGDFTLVAREYRLSENGLIRVYGKGGEIAWNAGRGSNIFLAAGETTPADIGEKRQAQANTLVEEFRKTLPKRPPFTWVEAQSQPWEFCVAGGRFINGSYKQTDTPPKTLEGISRNGIMVFISEGCYEFVHAKGVGRQREFVDNYLGTDPGTFTETSVSSIPLDSRIFLSKWIVAMLGRLAVEIDGAILKGDQEEAKRLIKRSQEISQRYAISPDDQEKSGSLIRAITLASTSLQPNNPQPPQTPHSSAASVASPLLPPKISNVRNVGISGILAILLIGLLVFFVWKADRIKLWNLGAPTFVIYLFAALLCGFLLFGVLHSAGQASGKQLGVEWEFGGPAALFIVVLSLGLHYEGRARTKDRANLPFGLTAFIFIPPNKNSILNVNGLITLYLPDKPTRYQIIDGHARIENLPPDLRHRTVPYSLDIADYAQVENSEPLTLVPDMTISIPVNPCQGSPVAVLSIIEARYGAKAKWVDVTSSVKDQIESTNGTATANTSVLGVYDPIYLEKKTLVVRYTINGAERQIEIPEDESRNLGIS